MFNKYFLSPNSSTFVCVLNEDSLCCVVSLGCMKLVCTLAVMDIELMPDGASFRLDWSK